MLGGENTWLSLFTESSVDTCYDPNHVVIGIQEVLTIQESYTTWQKNVFVYLVLCIERKCLQPLNELDRWDKCVTWIATKPS